MPDFNSPLGRRSFAASAQRVLTVPDEEMSALPPQEELATPNDVEAIQAARKARLLAAGSNSGNGSSGGKRISSVAKERIEILTGLGRCFDTVEFEGVTFSIQSLKAGEMRDIVRISNNALNAADSYFEARLQTLARSIYEIDGQPLSVVLGSNKLEDVVAWIEEMDEGLIELIHNRYLDMIRKNKTKFVIKNEEDAKEVAEDIKKS